MKRLPFVSICTPTFNRRPFVPMMLKCFAHQTYPAEKMEWIIVDDGTDSIEELLQEAKKSFPQINYFRYEEKMTLGKKRNIMNSKATGDIVVYMDDDDYYPPHRVSHAVESLLANPTYLIAGSSTMHIFFRHIDKIYRFGPYGPTHSTAATFAFRRKLLESTAFNNDSCFAEEKDFLKNYTIPLLQLDSLKTILVIAHDQNTFDKKMLLTEEGEAALSTEGEKKKVYFEELPLLNLTSIIGDEGIVQFIKNDVGRLIEEYSLGALDVKQDVVKALAERNSQFKLITEQQQKLMFIVNQFPPETNPATIILCLFDKLEKLEEKNNHLQKVFQQFIEREKKIIVIPKPLTLPPGL